MELSRWPDEDLVRLRAAAEEFLAQRAEDTQFSVQDREAYQVMLSKLRRYMADNNIYWSTRAVPSQGRLQPQRN